MTHHYDHFKKEILVGSKIAWPLRRKSLMELHDGIVEELHDTHIIVRKSDTDRKAKIVRTERTVLA